MVEELTLRVASFDASFEDAKRLTRSHTARLETLEEKQTEITDDVTMMTCSIEANRERIEELERLQDDAKQDDESSFVDVAQTSS